MGFQHPHQHSHKHAGWQAAAQSPRTPAHLKAHFQQRLSGGSAMPKPKMKAKAVPSSMMTKPIMQGPPSIGQGNGMGMTSGNIANAGAMPAKRRAIGPPLPMRKKKKRVPASSLNPSNFYGE